MSKDPFVLQLAPEPETIAELADKLETRYAAARAQARLPPWGDQGAETIARVSFADALRFAQQEYEHWRPREAAAWALIASRRAEERAAK